MDFSHDVETSVSEQQPESVRAICILKEPEPYYDVTTVPKAPAYVKQV
jgi:hypothetical protein